MSTEKTTTTLEGFYTWAQHQLSSSYSTAAKYQLTSYPHTVYEKNEDGTPKTQPRAVTAYDTETHKYVETGEIEQVAVWHDEPSWHLEVCGTGSSWRGNHVIYLPLEVGEALGKAWKKGDYGRFVGMRGLKSILAMFDANAAADIASQAKAIALRQEVVKLYNLRTNRRNEAKAAAEALAASLDKLAGVSVGFPVSLRDSLSILLSNLGIEQAADDLTIKEA